MRARAFTGTLLLILLALCATFSYSQAPQGFSYQAVIRNSTGVVIANQNVSLRISLLAADATVYYAETQTATTTVNGVVNLTVGGGTLVSGSFASVPWSGGDVRLKVEVDPAGGTAYVDMGTTRFYSVPYALFATNGPVGPAGPTGPIGPTGLTGATGPEGPAGPIGPAGKGILSTVDNGNGTLTFMFTDSSTFTTPNLTGLQGPKGDTGAQGPAGPQGETGAKGDIGNTGNGIATVMDDGNGVITFTFTDGSTYITPKLTGPAGPQGPIGEKGDKGDTGNQGLTGDTGNGIASVMDNANGTLTFNFTNGSTYTTPDLTGPEGMQGLPGAVGPQGPAGPKGDKGDTGNQGLQGVPGTGLNNKGAWVTGTTYGPGDYVFSESSASSTVNTMWIVQASAAFLSSTLPKNDLTNWVEFEAPAGPQGPQGPVGPLVSGTAGQTLRHDGTTWVANSTLFNDGSNIGIGSTSPSTKLHLDYGDNTNAAFVIDGGRVTGGLPRILFRNSYWLDDLNNGMAHIGAGDDGSGGGFLSFGTTADNSGTSGTPNERMRILHNGNVGIGTTNPETYKLNVNGGSVLINDGTGISGTLKFSGHSYIGSADWGNLYLSTGVNSGGAAMFFSTENAIRAAIIGNGNVGIGTVSPNEKLEINGNIKLTDNGQISSSDNNHRILFRRSENKLELREFGSIIFSSGSTTGTETAKMIINDIGNIGIGTTAPTQKLQVSGGNGIINNAFIGDVGHGANWASFAHSGMVNTTGYALLQSADGLYTLINRKSGAGYMGFRIDNIDKMVLSNTGNIGIGTNSPDAKLKIEDGGFAIGQASAINDTYGGQRTIQLSTQSGINGGAYDNHTGALIWSTLESGGWGDARLKIALGTNWGTYNTALPALSIGQNFLGVGTTTSGARMVVQGSTTAAVTEPLFQVKDKSGNPVFTVYQDSVRIVVYDGAKGSKGVFAVSGRNTSKAPTNDFLKISPEKARIWTTDANQGFAAENISGTVKEQYTKLTPNNTLIGQLAGKSITSGVSNVFIGTYAGYSNTSGAKNYYLGYYAGYSNTIGSNNIYIGDSSGFYSSNNGTMLLAQYNVFLGHKSGFSNVSGNRNVFIGFKAGYSNWGNSTLYPTRGVYNVYIGSYTATSNNGGNNVMLGDNAGKSLTLGSSNVYIGSSAGSNGTSGERNVYIGANAGKSETGSNNIIIGYNQGFGAGESNVLCIGSGSNSLITGYFNTSKLFLWADVGIGTGSPDKKLHVVGDARVTGSIYYGTGTTVYTKPDYVFDSEYDNYFDPLDVESYIKTNGHLPWLTKAQDEKDGVNLTRMQFETLETAENLQLQIIDMKKDYQQQIYYLTKRNEDLENKIREIYNERSNKQFSTELEDQKKLNEELLKRLDKIEQKLSSGKTFEHLEMK